MARLVESEETKWIEGRGDEAFDAFTDALFWLVESGTHNGTMMYQPMIATARLIVPEHGGDPGWVCDMIISAVSEVGPEIFDGELDIEDWEG